MIAEIQDGGGAGGAPDFAELVSCHYRTLYQFAFTLTRSESDACDLTQQTFYVWAIKGGQLRDVAKVKSWLFTTLHRTFLQNRRRQTRFPQVELSEAHGELPEIPPPGAYQLDSSQLRSALGQVDQNYQAPLALFYLEDHPYKEIARILDIPLGTVKSRIARGLAQLQALLVRGGPAPRPEARAPQRIPQTAEV
jgi:RNA polymerase sigma-70 factor (ECF subfamily)